MNPQHRSGALAALTILVFTALAVGGCGSGSGPSGGAINTGPAAIATPSTQGVGSATLSWQAPSTNTDGTALTDLAGFDISYGTDSASLTNSIRINTVGIATYVIDNLPAGTYYFTVSAYTTTGVQSAPSVMVSKVI